VCSSRRHRKLARSASAQAARAIKDSDGGRRDYLKRFYSVDQEAPTDYDLVINTDLLSTEQAAAIVVHAAGR